MRSATRPTLASWPSLLRAPGPIVGTSNRPRPVDQAPLRRLVRPVAHDAGGHVVGVRSTSVGAEAATSAGRRACRVRGHSGQAVASNQDARSAGSCSRHSLRRCRPPRCRHCRIRPRTTSGRTNVSARDAAAGHTRAKRRARATPRRECSDRSARAGSRAGAAGCSCASCRSRAGPASPVCRAGDGTGRRVVGWHLAGLCDVGTWRAGAGFRHRGVDGTRRIEQRDRSACIVPPPRRHPPQRLDRR